MSLEIKATIQGQATVIASLRAMMRRADNPSALMARISIIGFRDVMGHFSRQEGTLRSGSSPSPWKPLSESTIKRRRRGGGVAKALQDTGRLRGSIVPGTRGPRRAVVSTNVIYAATHHYGRGRVPSRPFMWLSKSSVERMTEAALQWVRRGRLL